MQNHLEGNNASCHHILERGDAVAVLIERAAADADGFGGNVDLIGLAGFQHALRLCDLPENLRQRGGVHDEVFWGFFHDVHLVCLR